MSNGEIKTPDRDFSVRLAIQNRAFRVTDEGPEGAISGDQTETLSRTEKCLNLGFLMLPGFSMLAISSALGVLSAANSISAGKLYEWQLISVDGGPVRSVDGFSVAADSAPDAAVLQQLDLLFVGGGSCPSAEPQLLSWLRQAGQQQLMLGGLGDGSLLLARAGVLDGYRCAVHWEYLATMREQFSRVSVHPNFFTIDRDRLSCCGGSSALDLVLELVSRQRGEDLALAVSELLVCERVRDKQDTQPAPLKARLGSGQPKLTEAIALMEANLEEPMSLEDLSVYADISRRHLERLFQKYLGCTPSRYYLELRLTRARQLLARTDKSVIEVGIASGFSSGTHFSRCYRQFFGVSPREARKRYWQEGGRKPDETGPVQGALAAV